MPRAHKALPKAMRPRFQNNGGKARNRSLPSSEVLPLSFKTMAPFHRKALVFMTRGDFMAAPDGDGMAGGENNVHEVTREGHPASAQYSGDLTRKAGAPNTP